MGIHGDDVIRVIRDALKVTDTAGMQTQVRCYPRALTEHETPTNTWRNRDGRLEFDCVGRDWFRAFHITVEAFSVDDFDVGTTDVNEWVIGEPQDETFAAMVQEARRLMANGTEDEVIAFLTGKPVEVVAKVSG